MALACGVQRKPAKGDLAVWGKRANSRGEAERDTRPVERGGPSGGRVPAASAWRRTLLGYSVRRFLQG